MNSTVILLAYLWAVSAGCAWESLATELGHKGRWLEVTVGALLPIYNSYVAVRYVRDLLKELIGD